MSVTHVKGDLFGAEPHSALAHCISADAAMGKGIAVLFRDRFGQVGELKRQIQSQASPIGTVAVLRAEDRYVYYLITKARYFHKPTYEALRNSLEAMRDHAVSHGVQRISMPKIGCGLDKLEWPEVERILCDVFKNVSIELSVYSL